MPFQEESPLGQELGQLAIDLVEIARMHPESRPHRLLGRDPGPLAALIFDRLILAAARKYRTWLVANDTAEPGDFGLNGILSLLARANVMRT
jgi:hypothetical protein